MSDIRKVCTIKEVLASPTPQSNFLKGKINAWFLGVGNLKVCIELLVFTRVVRDEGALNVPFLLCTLLSFMNVSVFPKSWINIRAVLL